MSRDAAQGHAVANVELVKGVFDALADSGVRAVAGAFDPGVEVFSTPALANAGSYHGVAGLLRWAERWFDAWETFEIQVGLYEPVGERHVVATCRQVGRGKGSGATAEMDAAYMAEMTDGQIARFHLYATREEALAEARAGERRLSSPS